MLKRVFLPRPLPHQVPILVDPARYKVVVCGRRWGKTVLGLVAVVTGHGPDGRFKGALYGGKGFWVAPTYAIASDIWRALKEALHEVWTDKSEVERRIELPGGGSVSVKSADNPDSLRGAGLDFVVIDEAAFVTEETWKQVLRPTLADREGWAIFISTPNGQNWLFDEFQQAPIKPGWARWQRPTSDNPRIKATELEASRRELGSHVFAQEFEAEFVTPGGGLFKKEWFRYYTDLENAPGWIQFGNAETFRVEDLTRFLTVDLATTVKQTSDYTAIATWGLHPDGRIFLLDMVRERLEGPDILPWIRRIVERWGAGTVWIERTGFQLALVQEAVRDDLPAREFDPRPYGDKWQRAITATPLFEQGRVLFPRSATWLSDIESELVAFSPKADHDDQTDTVSMAAIVSRQLGGQVSSPPGYAAPEWGHPLMD